MKALVRLYKVWALCWGPWESWTRVFSRGVSHSDVCSRKIPVVSVRGNMLEGDIPVRTLWKKSRHKMMLARINQWQWEETEWMVHVCLGGWWMGREELRTMSKLATWARRRLWGHPQRQETHEGPQQKGQGWSHKWECCLWRIIEAFGLTLPSEFVGKKNRRAHGWNPM